MNTLNHAFEKRTLCPWKTVLLPVLLLWFQAAAMAQFSPGSFALKNVTVIDGISEKPLSGYTILVNRGKIAALGPMNTVTIPDSAIIINGAGRYVIPGLIDAHVHMMSDVSNTDFRGHAEKDLKDMLFSGITSVRDMAGDSRSLAGLARDALVNEITAPDIYYVSLMAGPSFFSDPRTGQASVGGTPGQMMYMRAVTDSTDLRQAIAESKGTGATAIKLYAEISGSLAAKITAEAHRQGMKVWSHTDLTKASPLEVINAGVDCISHATMIARWRPGKTDSIPLSWRKPGLDSLFWDEQFRLLPVNDYISAMKKNHTVLDATLLIYKEMKDDPDNKPYRKYLLTAFYEIGRRFTKLALQSGIPVCTGTDVDEDRFVQREMTTLVTDAGFTPMQALISATRNGARAIGIETKTGTIETGKDADLVILNANPAERIENIHQVYMVIKKGKLYNRH